jgi:hypothetical protein
MGQELLPAQSRNGFVDNAPADELFILAGGGNGRKRG